MADPPTPARFCPICGALLDAAVCPTDEVPTVRADFDRAPARDEALGRVIAGRFRVERLLGEGATGRVYAATQLSIGREVALKLLQPHRVPDRQQVRRFYREARAATRLSGEHVVRVYDFGVDDESQTPFIAMELIGGETLRELLDRSGPLQPALVAHLGLQVAKALAEAADAGLVHRDLKPANILVVDAPGARPLLKVADFGVAKDLEREDTDTLTAHGVAIGTPGYMAPEQLSGGAIGPATDLYALGCILYELLTGARPFVANARATLMVEHLLSPVPPLPDPLPSGAPLPEQLGRLVLQLLEKAPAARPAGARAVAEALGVLASEAHLPLVEARGKSPPMAPATPTTGRVLATETGGEVTPGHAVAEPTLGATITHRLASGPSSPSGLATAQARPALPPRARRLAALGSVLAVAAVSVTFVALRAPPEVSAVAGAPGRAAAATAPRDDEPPASAEGVRRLAAASLDPTVAVTPPVPGPLPVGALAIHQLVVRGSAATVWLHPGAARPAQVEGDASRLSAILEGPRLTLIVQSARDDSNDAAPLQIHLWSPAWRTLQVAGSATVMSGAVLPVESLSLALSGSARAVLELRGRSLTTSLRGSCEAELRGSIEDHDGRTGGAARLDASRLHTRSTSVSAGGTSEATVFATEHLDARNESTGELVFFGHPKELTQAGASIRPGD